MKTDKRKCKITFHEEVFTYKNLEKYDEDVLEVDNNLLKIYNNDFGVLRRINLYSEKENNKECNVKGENETKTGERKYKNKIITNIKNEIKYMDILICGDKNSGKTTFLNCVSCIDRCNPCSYAASNIGTFSGDEEGENKTRARENMEKKEIIWNNNKLEFLSYVPIIFSKLINRNYDQLKKYFKKIFIDTDICEASIFITKDDLDFINYEFCIGTNFCMNDFDYLKIIFCEFGEDLFRKIRMYYEVLRYTDEEEKGEIMEEAKRGVTELCKFTKMTYKRRHHIRNVKRVFLQSNIVNIIEGALLRIKETKYITYFINLKRSFFLLKSSSLIYNIMIKKMLKRRYTHKERGTNKMEEKTNTKPGSSVSVGIDIGMRICASRHSTMSPLRRCNIRNCIMPSDRSLSFTRFFKKKKKKNLFLIINEEHILKTISYLNIVKDLNNYDRKEVLFVASRSFDFEKLSRKFHIYFNLNHNLGLFKRFLQNGKIHADKERGMNIIPLRKFYRLIKKCVNEKWRVQHWRGRKKHMTEGRRKDIIFKYYSEKKLQGVRKNYAEGKRTRGTQRIHGFSKNGSGVGSSGSILPSSCDSSGGSDCSDDYSGKARNKFSFLVEEKVEVDNFFKLFYDEYIYKNKNRSYVKMLVKENFDICFLFMKLCFYYKEHAQLRKKCERVNKINIHKFVYLKQIDIIKKDNCLSYYNICVPSCVYVFINLLKMKYESYPFRSLREYKIFSMLKFIFYAIIYYKYRKRSYDFLPPSKTTQNHICYFTQGIIINSIIDLFEKKRRETEMFCSACSDGEHAASSNSPSVPPSPRSQLPRDIPLSPYHKKCRRNRNILRGIINNVHINIPPYIVVGNVKANWVYFKKYLINSNMCSYYNGSTHIYPNVSFEIVLNCEIASRGDLELAEKCTLFFTPLYNVHLKEKITKKKKILHFPFTHRLLKYFVDNIPRQKREENNYNFLLQLLCNAFLKMVKYLLICYYKNKGRNCKIKVRHIFILLNYVMDIYYLMAYEEKRIYISKDKDFVIENYLHDKCLHKGEYVKERKRKISFHIYQNNALFNCAYFLWEEIKNLRKNSKINKYLRYLRKHLFFSIRCDEMEGI
ncbi:conserved Plasmodium protein, unknown function [Plasmodium ovale]|uniref:Uncharacterized protein n=2 Tax=Plasmodium ovale TaxID=36330 RepID=A0A1A8WMV6_PLAOA|nr:hypothetical protein, conserved [Plasmodium ovale curtisi]SBS93569.1 hypothetical protein, conserved [Plasmodium ovale curtisi]SCP04875.1 conserved Plasmodium protein, unknown function [Plasmodium ovale]